MEFWLYRRKEGSRARFRKFNGPWFSRFAADEGMAEASRMFPGWEWRLLPIPEGTRPAQFSEGGAS